MRCRGDESSLMQCRVYDYFVRTGGLYDQEDYAGVRCIRRKTSENEQ